MMTALTILLIDLTIDELPLPVRITELMAYQRNPQGAFLCWTEAHQTRKMRRTSGHQTCAQTEPRGAAASAFLPSNCTSTHLVDVNNNCFIWPRLLFLICSGEVPYPPDTQMPHHCPHTIPAYPESISNLSQHISLLTQYTEMRKISIL